MDPENSLSKPRANGFVLWVVILVLLFLFFAALGWHRTLISTEVWALYYAGRPFAEHMAAVRADLVHPPLFYLVERGWLALFGQSDNSAKSLSLVISVANIFLMSLLARRVTLHWRLLSFFLVSVFLRFGSVPTLVRMYGLGILLVVAAILFWDNWRAAPRTLNLVAWTCVATLLVYVHLFGSLVVFAFVVANWLFGPRKWAFTAAAALCGALFLPWVFYVFPVYLQRGLEPNLSWVHQSLLGAIVEFIGQLLGVIGAASSRTQLVLTLLSAAIHVCFLALAWMFRDRLWPLRGEHEAERRWFWSAFVLTAIPVAILLVFSVAIAKAFEARFVLGVLPSYWIAVFLLCRLSGRAGWVVLLLVLLPWKLVSVGNGIYGSRTPDWQRTATTFVSQQVRPDDLLLASDPGSSNTVYWEWTRRLHRTERIESLPSEGAIAQRMAVVKPVPLEQLDLNGVSRIWLFYKSDDTKESISEFLKGSGFAPAPQSTSGIPHLLLLAREGTARK